MVDFSKITSWLSDIQNLISNSPQEIAKVTSSMKTKVVDGKRFIVPSDPIDTTPIDKNLPKYTK